MRDRIAQLQRGMAESDLDAIVLRLPENVLLATGWWVQISGLGIVVVPREGEAALLLPEYEAAEAATRFDGELRTFLAIRADGPPAGESIAAHLKALAIASGAVGGRIGFEGSFEQLAPSTLDGEPNAVAEPTRALIRSTFATEALVDVTELLESTRAVKTEAELARIRRTNEIAMMGCAAFREAVRPGRTEVEIAAAVESAILIGGHGYGDARVVRAYATVCSGPDLAANGWQYFRSRPRVIEAGETVMLELGTCADGYWSDHTRTHVAGAASAAQREAFAVARGATRAAFAAARPGATGGEVDAASRAFVREHGYEQFPHHTGHGTGFRYHESRPQITIGSTHPLAAGHVIVAEPGIYLPGVGGFRWEDDAVVGPGGAVELATSDDGIA